MVKKGESKSPKRKPDGSSATSSSATRGSRQKLTDAFPEVSKRIKVYKNGEVYDQGITFVLNMRKTHDIGTFLDLVTSRIGLVLGAKRLYTLDGKLVKKTNELENGKEYVASSGAFTPLPYGKKKLEREHSSVSRTTSRSRSSGPSRTKSTETLTKKTTTKTAEKVNGTLSNSYGRSKSQVSLKTKAIPNGTAKIVIPVATKRAKKDLTSTVVSTKKGTNAVRDRATGAINAKTAATKVEKKVSKDGEKVKKQGLKGKKKVKEAVVAEAVKAKSPSPPPKSPTPPPRSPTPREKTPSPTESPRPKTASRPATAASKKHSEDEKSESGHESGHEEEERESEEKSGSERSATASESEEETENEEEEATTSERSRASTRASSHHESRRASLKSNKSTKSHHG